MTFEEWADSVAGTGILRPSCGYEQRAARAAWDAATAAGEARVKDLEESLQHANRDQITAQCLKTENAELREAVTAARDLFGAHAAKSVHIESVFEHFSDAEDLMNKALESTSRENRK